ncbi:MAG: alanine--tRNA ligase-related protein [bacterium]
MTSQELKQNFLDFFKSKNHAIIPSASLVPENDPTVLFTTAGMHPLVPYLLGEKHPMGKRLANCQKCLRTDDIDQVGDEMHLTFFEMLGNWSLGDYWKEEAIKFALEFLTKNLKIPKSKLEVTCFEGGKDAPRDNEAAKIWKKLGIKKIKFLGKKDNWWGPAGKTGPCGPDTEIFYKNVEIWNLVFMQYNKKPGGVFEVLKQKNVDTGMGLARLTALLNNKNSVFETDLFYPGIKTREQRIVADHTRAAINIIQDGIKPSNSEQGYVLRRLIRRAMRYDKNILEIAEKFTNKQDILEIISQEQEKFGRTLERGLHELQKPKKTRTAFDYYQSFGLPIDVIKEYVKVDEQDFEQKLKEHQEKSRTAAKGKFKAGLADHSEATTKLHTATHLLLAALRQVLGEHIKQAGSNINPERLRFDFTHSQKLTPEEIQKIENFVNQKIQENLPVAKSTQGPIIYYSIGDFSQEKCAGPHIENIGQLGKFKIIKEESSSAGVRRIRAILET